jgi:putative glutamine amidotransferase
MREHLPLVGIPCDRRMLGDHAFHLVGEKYIDAVREGSRTIPFLIPSLDPPLSPEAILPDVDGLLFTGSPSNVAPHHYGGHEPRPKTLLDEARDAIALPLMREAASAGVPVLCICRGFQELNVAFGGTLHQHLREIEGYTDHSVGDRKRSLEAQYGPVHNVRVEPGGLLEHLLPELGAGGRFKVNSLHGQGIDLLAPALRIEAISDDGVIEAVSLKNSKAFLLGVQWHPEWRHAENPVSRVLFSAFGDAVRAYAQKRRQKAAANLP